MTIQKADATNALVAEKTTKRVSSVASPSVSKTSSSP